MFGWFFCLFGELTLGDDGWGQMVVTLVKCYAEEYQVRAAVRRGFYWVMDARACGIKDLSIEQTQMDDAGLWPVGIWGQSDHSFGGTGILLWFVLTKFSRRILNRSFRQPRS